MPVILEAGMWICVHARHLGSGHVDLRPCPSSWKQACGFASMPVILVAGMWICVHARHLGSGHVDLHPCPSSWKRACGFASMPVILEAGMWICVHARHLGSGHVDLRPCPSSWKRAVDLHPARCSCTVCTTNSASRYGKCVPTTCTRRSMTFIPPYCHRSRGGTHTSH